MCVVLASTEGNRFSPSIITRVAERMHAGFGVAWIENKEVKWIRAYQQDPLKIYAKIPKGAPHIVQGRSGEYAREAVQPIPIGGSVAARGSSIKGVVALNGGVAVSDGYIKLFNALGHRLPEYDQSFESDLHWFATLLGHVRDIEQFLEVIPDLEESDYIYFDHLAYVSPKGVHLLVGSGGSWEERNGLYSSVGEYLEDEEEDDWSRRNRYLNW